MTAVTGIAFRDGRLRYKPEGTVSPGRARTTPVAAAAAGLRRQADGALHEVLPDAVVARRDLLHVDLGLDAGLAEEAPHLVDHELAVRLVQDAGADVEHAVLEVRPRRAVAVLERGDDGGALVVGERRLADAHAAQPAAAQRSEE